MPRIDEYAEAVDPIGPDAPAVELLSRFEADPDLHHLPVLDGDRVLGLVERSALLMRLTVSPAAPMTASQLMDAEPVVVDGGIGARALCDILLRGGPAAIMRGFIVTVAGRYHGVGAPATLLRALNGLAPGSRDEAGDKPAADGAGTADLMAMIDSELRVPINGILAVADLLRRQALSGDMLDHVKLIEEQIHGLLNVVEDAGVLAGQGEPSKPEPTGLRALMDDIEQAWSGRAALNGVTLMVGYEGDTELTADLDARRLRRVFDNLIGNALKFAREGMVEARLKAHLVGPAIHLSARVRDDGPRVDARDLGRLLQSRDSTEGGFALSVCRRLVAGLDGRIWAENNAGRGTTINFELQAPRSAPAIEPASNVQALTNLDFEVVPHILIVDDNATNRVVAQALCEMFGCSCETAEDGVEALEAVQARPFDLILMDIKMPRMDGIQATRAIRALPAPQCHVPIIALTANADPADAAAYIASGMAAVVEKPIKPERLRMAMNAALVSSEPDMEDDSASGRRSA